MIMAGLRCLQPLSQSMGDIVFFDIFVLNPNLYCSLMGPGAIYSAVLVVFNSKKFKVISSGIFIIIPAGKNAAIAIWAFFDITMHICFVRVISA